MAAVQREIKKLTADERRSLKAKVAAEENLDAAVAALRKMTKGNTAGASFSSKTSGLTLPVADGTVREYKKNMAEIVGQKGSRVRSIYEGKVIDIRQNKVTGMWDVFIAHGEYITSYSNLSEVKVKVKDVVVERQTIGTIGAAINITSAKIEYKMVFGIYGPNPKQVMKASDCFKRK
jgi:murein DD-endopeptidase MepM/ murein hydrolase activator NlpD